MIRTIFGSLFLLTAGALLLAAHGEYRRQRWMGWHGCSMRASPGPFACLLVLAVIAVSAGLWLLRII